MRRKTLFSSGIIALVGSSLVDVNKTQLSTFLTFLKVPLTTKKQLITACLNSNN